MTPARPSPSAIHLRIGRLVVDAGALGEGGVPGDLYDRLREALASHLEARTAAGPAPRDWIDSVASDVASGIQASRTERPR